MNKVEYFGRMYPDSVAMLMDAGISLDDAIALRRISMTLHRWHELECGDGNSYGSWAIARGRKEKRYGQHENGHGAHLVFVHDDDGTPFMEHHHYLHGKGKDYVSYSPLPDRERGALKRLAKIMARYPAFWVYVQTDPRGCSLYVGKIDDLPIDARGESHPMGQPLDLSSHYNRGIAVYK